MLINSLSDLRKAFRHGPYAWPGGYPVYFVMADGAALSFKSARENRREMIAAFCKYGDPDWKPVALEINWEDDSLVDSHTGEKIESAYG